MAKMFLMIQAKSIINVLSLLDIFQHSPNFLYGPVSRLTGPHFLPVTGENRGNSG